MQFDAIFVTGVAAVVSGVIVFCGSVWLLLTMVLGARLAYFVTASVTLAFLLIMGVVWSIGTPLGPVGEFGKPAGESMPHWAPVAIGEDPAAVDFAAAADYPEEPWKVPDEENQQEVTRAAELESGASDYLQTAIEEEKITNFGDAEEAQVVEESARLLTQGDVQYGAITFQLSETFADQEARAQIARVAYEKNQAPPVVTDAEIKADADTLIDQAGTVAVVMRFEEGNPLGKARVITGVTALLLGAHLFGLSRSERRAARVREATP